MYEKVKIFTDFGGNHVLLKALGDQAPFGHWASSRYLHNYPVSAGNKRFVDNFRKAYNVYPDMMAGEAYSTVHVIAESIRRAGVVDKEKAIDVMGGRRLQLTRGMDHHAPIRSPRVAVQLLGRDFKKQEISFPDSLEHSGDISRRGFSPRREHGPGLPEIIIAREADDAPGSFRGVASPFSGGPGAWNWTSVFG